MRRTIMLVLFFFAACTAETTERDADTGEGAAKAVAPKGGTEGSAAKQARPGDPKADCESVMSAVVPFATEMLSKHREFHPFGGTMSTDGEVGMSAGWTGDERPPPTEVIAVLKSGFRKGAVAGQYRATAIVFDVRTVPPGKTEKQDAIAVSLEHRDDYAVTVVFPYSFTSGGALAVEESFTVKAKAEIFVQ